MQVGRGAADAFERGVAASGDGDVELRGCPGAHLGLPAAGGRTSGGSKGIAVDFRYRQRAPQACEADRPIPTVDSAAPAALVAAPQLDLHLTVCDEHDFFERGDPFVVGELLTAVVSFGGGAEHFEDDARVDGGMTPRVVRVEFELVTDNRRVGVRAEAGFLDPNAQRFGEHPAGPTPERRAQRGYHVASDGGVFRRATGHRPDLAVHVLVLHTAFRLELQILGEREALAGKEGHGPRAYQPGSGPAWLRQRTGERGARQTAGAAPGWRKRMRDRVLIEGLPGFVVVLTAEFVHFIGREVAQGQRIGLDGDAVYLPPCSTVWSALGSPNADPSCRLPGDGAQPSR